MSNYTSYHKVFATPSVKMLAQWYNSLGLGPAASIHPVRGTQRIDQAETTSNLHEQESSSSDDNLSSSDGSPSSTSTIRSEEDLNDGAEVERWLVRDSEQLVDIVNALASRCDKLDPEPRGSSASASLATSGTTCVLPAKAAKIIELFVSFNDSLDVGKTAMDTEGRQDDYETEANADLPIALNEQATTSQQSLSPSVSLTRPHQAPSVSSSTMTGSTAGDSTTSIRSTGFDSNGKVLCKSPEAFEGRGSPQNNTPLFMHLFHWDPTVRSKAVGLAKDRGIDLDRMKDIDACLDVNVLGRTFQQVAAAFHAFGVTEGEYRAGHSEWTPDRHGLP